MSFAKKGRKIDKKIKSTKNSYNRGKRNADSKKRTERRALATGTAVGAAGMAAGGGLGAGLGAGAAAGAVLGKGRSRRSKVSYQAGRAATAASKAKKGAYKMTAEHKRKISQALKGRKRR